MMDCDGDTQKPKPALLPELLCSQCWKSNGKQTHESYEVDLTGDADRRVVTRARLDRPTGTFQLGRKSNFWCFIAQDSKLTQEVNFKGARDSDGLINMLCSK